MKILEIQMKNFGRFSDHTFRFADGLNVIYGENETGKTTLYTAIGALLYGLEKKRGRAAACDTYTTYRPWENAVRYEAAMRFETGGKCFFLERNFNYSEKSARLVCETDGEELDVFSGDLDMLLNYTAADLFFNTAAAGQLKMKPGDAVYNYLRNYIAALEENGSYATDVVRAVEILEKKKKLLEQEEKKRILEIRREIQKAESKMELLEHEKEDCKGQIRLLENKCREEAQEHCALGFWEKILFFLKKIFFSRRFREEKERKQSEREKRRERVQMLKEMLNEKISLLEEYILIREQLYEKLEQNPRETELRALELAADRIREISVTREEEVLERLISKASRTLCDITAGKYKKLIFEKEGETKVWDGHRMLKLFQVSTGCADQIYLSIRIALQDLFFEDETLPLIFDDAFVYFDDKRLAQLLGLLSGLHRQVLIFTCGKREETLLREIGKECYTINLQ